MIGWPDVCRWCNSGSFVWLSEWSGAQVQLSLSLDWSATRAKNLTLYKRLDLFLPAQRQTHVKIPTAGVFNLSPDSCADRVSAAYLSNNGLSSRCFSLGTNAPYSSTASYPTSVCNSLYFHVTQTSSTASRIRSPLQPGCPHRWWMIKTFPSF